MLSAIRDVVPDEAIRLEKANYDYEELKNFIEDYNFKVRSGFDQSCPLYGINKNLKAGDLLSNKTNVPKISKK